MGAVLYDYDIDLTDYAIGNVVQYLPDKTFARWAVDHISSPAVVEYLRKRSDRSLDAPQVRELFCDEDLAAIEAAFEDGPPGRVGEWVPYAELHRRYVQTLREVREGLSRQTADEWATDCAEYAIELEADGLSLHDGLKIVRRWIQRLRELQMAMGAVEFVPAADVTKWPPPPPGSPAATDASQEDALQLAASIGRMRDAIKALGADAKSETLVKHAHIKKQDGVRALRVLEERGEYTGFARPHPPKRSDS